MSIKTTGEKRVRVNFNPSDNGQVHIIKQKSAELINLCDEMTVGAERGEKARLTALAMTAYEEAAMWAVKAATI